MLSKQQISNTEAWVYANARPIEAAKWNLICGKGSADEVVAEMLKYQNSDGGFGHGFESDILTPESSAIASAEAIFTARDYGLDLNADWGRKLLAWFENTAADTPSFWEPVPPSVMDYPHPPWWNYQPDTSFSPNPCAVIASALFLGTASQRTLGEKVTRRCIDFILHDGKLDMHNTYCLQRLFLALVETNSPLVTAEVTDAMNLRVFKEACTDQSKWMKYVAQPLDMVDSPDSYWYGLLKDEIPANLDYWESTLDSNGCWVPNFSWGMDTEASRAAIKNWVGYMAVKRVKILKAFGRVEL